MPNSDDEKTLILNGSSNYNQWAKAMQFKLRAKGLWQYTQDHTPLTKPDKHDEDLYPRYATLASSKKKYKSHKTKFKQYEENLAAAMYLIFRSVAEVHQPIIETAENPKDMWTALSIAFDAKTDGRGLSADALRNAMNEMRYDFHSGIDEFCSTFTHCVNMLRQVENSLRDNEVINKFVNALPAECGHLKSVMRFYKESLPPMAEGTVWIKVVERYKTEILELELDANKDEAFLAKAKGRGKKQSNPAPKKKKVFCDHCEVPGHAEKDCFKKDPAKLKAYNARREEKGLKPIDPPNTQNVRKRPSTTTLDKDKVKKRPTSVSEFGFMATVEEISDDEERLLVVDDVKHRSALDWYSDSACSSHMCCNPDYFTSLSSLTRPTMVKVGNGAKIPATAIGNVVLHLHIREKDNDRYQKVLIRDVLYVPLLWVNLLSIRQLGELGVSTHFLSRKTNSESSTLRAEFRKADKCIATATLRNQQYVLDLAPTKRFRNRALTAQPTPDSTLPAINDDSDTSMSSSDDRIFVVISDDELSSAESSNTELAYANQFEEVEARLDTKITATQFQNLWHHRLGHPNENVMRIISEKSDIKDKEHLRTCRLGRNSCISCAEGKSCRAAHTTASKLRARDGQPTPADLLEIVHIDTSGKINPPSRTGFNYFQLYVDDKTSYSTITFLKKKSDSLGRLKEFRHLMETQTGVKIKRIKTDNGSEFVSKAGSRFLKSEGLIHELSPVYSPQMNGKPERFMQTVTNRALCMMFTSGCPSYLWDKAFAYANYVTCRLPCTQNDNNLSPYEAWNGVAPKLRQLRIFGCTAYAHIPSQKRKKLDKTAVRGVFVGIQGEDTGIYKIWVPSSNKVILSADVMFDEFNFDEVSKNSGVKPNGLNYSPNRLDGVNKRKSISDEKFIACCNIQHLCHRVILSLIKKKKTL